LNHRLIAGLTALAAIAALGTAYFAQYVLLLTPCELCLYERWPYRIVIALALIAALQRPRIARLFLLLAALTLLCGAAIAFVHVGVEQYWWKSPLPECNGALTPGAPLPLFPATPCDRQIYLIPHLYISMARMDFATALTFALLLLAYVLPRRRYRR
jgi:disulfide bond formation protein DsbB